MRILNGNQKQKLINITQHYYISPISHILVLESMINLYASLFVIITQRKQIAFIAG